MSQKIRNLLIVGVGTLVFPALAVCVYVCIFFVFNARQAIQYLIPDGYVGWIRVEYEVKDHLALSRREGYFIAKIPPNGILQTSSKNQQGWAVDKYYYLTQAGQRDELRIQTPDSDGMVLPLFSGRNSEGLFIGTKEQLDKFGWAHSGKYGPIKIPQ